MATKNASARMAGKKTGDESKLVLGREFTLRSSASGLHYVRRCTLALRREYVTAGLRRNQNE